MSGPLPPGDSLPADLVGLDALLTTHSLGRAVVFVTTVDSTMRLARDLAPSAPDGLVVLADHQTAGRGRQGRTWEDAPGAAILASLIVRLPPSVPPTRAVLALAVGVADGLAALGVDARLKWPNDVRVGGRKVAGMLATGLLGGQGGRRESTVVLGLGLNAHRASVPESLREIATSVEDEIAGGAGASRARVLAAVLNAAEPWLDRAADGRALVARYTAHLDGLGAPLTLDTGAGNRLIGLFEGVDDDGALRLRGPDGVVRRHHAGDVHTVPAGRTGPQG